MERNNFTPSSKNNTKLSGLDYYQVSFPSSHGLLLTELERCSQRPFYCNQEDPECVEIQQTMRSLFFKDKSSGGGGLGRKKAQINSPSRAKKAASNLPQS
mmetsp:Transcript_16039/g.28356  ORF Transcript_16039/g.28356 Transcript_16039/m.28356 type:complete len:100 (+) Transcript_16039:218-517(+)